MCIGVASYSGVAITCFVSILGIPGPQAQAIKSHQPEMKSLCELSPRGRASRSGMLSQAFQNSLPAVSAA